MSTSPPLVPRDGRSPGWRLGMLVGGAVLGGIGYAILRWPQIIVWAVAGAFFAVGAVLVLSAAFARGRRSS
ncbi:MAG: hypothetical protein QNJ90_03425 [Planctomycetota bacterium]|nr:hypothetical protein [Planctomycetota bacterium]